MQRIGWVNSPTCESYRCHHNCEGLCTINPCEENLVCMDNTDGDTVVTFEMGED